AVDDSLPALAQGPAHGLAGLAADERPDRAADDRAADGADDRDGDEAAHGGAELGTVDAADHGPAALGRDAVAGGGDPLRRGPLRVVLLVVLPLAGADVVQGEGGAGDAEDA